MLLSLSRACLLFVVLAFARGDGNEYSDQGDSSENEIFGGLDFDSFLKDLFPDDDCDDEPCDKSTNGESRKPMGPGQNPLGDFKDLEKQLEMLKGIAEKIGAGALPGGMGSPFGQMGPGMPPMGIWQPRPWMAMLEEELNPLPPYRIPPYLPAVGPSPTIYDKIDFAAIRPTLEPELLAAIRDVVDPMELRRIIAPKIYKLRAGCAVNVMQRLVSAGLTRWADQGMHHIAMEMSQFAPGEDVYPLAHAIKEEVMGEINRTIFGPEFQEFGEMLNFIQMAVRWNLRSGRANGTMEGDTNQTTERASVVFPLLQYLLQCKTRQSFLQELLTRIATLKRRVLFAHPWPFMARIMKSLFPCGEMASIPNKAEMTYKIYQGTSYSLNLVQRELGRLIWNVERAIIFGDDIEIANIFPEFLGNQTSILMQTLTRIRNADGPPPVFPSPPPTPSGPDSDHNETWDYNPQGNDTWENTPADNSTSGQTALPSPPPETTSPSNSTQRRSNSEKLLNLLLKRLLASERKRSLRD